MGSDRVARKRKRLTLEIDPSWDKATRDAFKWWVRTAALDFHESAGKIHEYGGVGEGSADLRVMGFNQAELLVWREASEATRQEVAVWFYLQGKIARLISDYQQQKPGKSDTWFDITVYSMMARRLQAVGRWP